MSPLKILAHLFVLGVFMLDGVQPFGNVTVCTRREVENRTRDVIGNTSIIFDLKDASKADQCGKTWTAIVRYKNVSLACDRQTQGSDDSTSWESLQRYSKGANLRNMATAYRLLCSVSVGKFNADAIWTIEPNTLCNKSKVFQLLGNLTERRLRQGDMLNCSEMTTGLAQLKEVSEGCSWEIKSVVSILMGTAKMNYFSACTPGSCNVKYAQMCLDHAEETMPDNFRSLNNADRRMACQNLKHSLACVTNHTRSCSGDIYSSVSRRFESIKARFMNNNCTAFFPRPTDCKPRSGPQPRPQPVNDIQQLKKKATESFFSSRISRERCRKYATNFTGIALFNGTRSNVTLYRRTVASLECDFEAPSARALPLLCLTGNCSGENCTSADLKQCLPGQVCGFLCRSDSKGKCLNYIERGCQNVSYCDKPKRTGQVRGCCVSNLCECSCSPSAFRATTKAIIENADPAKCKSTIDQDAALNPIRQCSLAERRSLESIAPSCVKTKLHEIGLAYTNEEVCTQRKCPSQTELKNMCLPVTGFSCTRDILECLAFNSLGCQDRERVVFYLLTGDQLEECDANLINSVFPAFQSTPSLKPTASQCLLRMFNKSEPICEALNETRYCIAEHINDLYAPRVVSFLDHLILAIDCSALSDNCQVTSKFGPTLFMTLAQLFQRNQFDVAPCTNMQVFSDFVKTCYPPANLAQVSRKFNDVIRLVCGDSPMFNCSLVLTDHCFANVDESTNLQDYIDAEVCVNTTFPKYGCDGLVHLEALNSIRAFKAYNLARVLNGTNGTNVTQPLSNATCGCDPVAAVHCVMDVQHMSKQLTPDWNRVCPILANTSTCAADYVTDCDECKKKTVMDIVSGLNSQLKKVCKDPPPTTCHSHKGLECINELESFKDVAAQFEDQAICIKITQTRRCVYESTKDCDESTSMALLGRLQFTIETWMDLKCDADELLGSCLDLFQKEVLDIFNFTLDGVSQDLNSSALLAVNRFAGICEQANIAWSCIEDVLSVEDRGVQTKIVRTTLTAVFAAVRYECSVRPNASQPLLCYSCDTQAGCDQNTNVKRCGLESTCHTVANRDGETYSVMKKGCVSRGQCIPGCEDGVCTFCCETSKCNNVSYGPIEGSCDVRKFSQCLLSIGVEYAENNRLECSKAELALECVRKVEKDCELGGNVELTKIMQSINISIEVQQCLIKESNQTCSQNPILTSYNYIYTFGATLRKDELCRVLRENREQLKIANRTCTVGEFRAINRTMLDVENLIGDINCSSSTGDVVSSRCTPVKAIECALVVMNVTSIDSITSLTCTQYSKIKACMKNLTSQCTEGHQLTLVFRQLSILRMIVTDSGNCPVSNTTGDPRVGLVTSCVVQFLTNESLSFPDAAANFLSCLLGAGIDDVLNGSLLLQSYSGFVANFAEELNQILSGFNYSDFTAGVSPKCESRIHFSLVGTCSQILSAPSLSISQRAAMCLNPDTILASLSSDCGGTDLSALFGVLDTLREKFLTGFCPDVEPVPRCMISLAEARLTSFSTYFGIGAGGVVCKEARAAVAYAVRFTSNCSYDQLAGFRSRVSFTVDFISQACRADAQLVKWARCTLMGQKDVVIPASSTCQETQVPDCFGKDPKTLPCRVLEAGAPCIFNKTVGCGTNIDVSDTLEPLRVCRAESSQRLRSVKLKSLRPCSEIPYECDPDAARKCLLAFVHNSDVTTVKSCLNTNYNCFGSMVTLLRQNVSLYAGLVSDMLTITPSWRNLDSSALIKLLTLPSYISGVFDQYSSLVSLDLFDVCIQLDSIANRISDILKSWNEEERFADVITWFKRSEDSLNYTINTLCNDVALVGQSLEFPRNGQENASCKALVIKSRLDLLIASSITEYYTPDGFSTICSQYKNFTLELEANLLKNCSSGFSTKVHFVARAVHAILGRTCQMPDFSVRRCDVGRVRACVAELYEVQRLVGVNATDSDVCTSLDKTEKCVERFSYKCDSFRGAQIDWIFSTARASSVGFYCKTEGTEPVCEPKDQGDPKHERCNIPKARSCSCKNMRLFSNNALSKEKKCRKILENYDCMAQNIKKCSGRLPRLFLSSEKDVKTAMRRFGCDYEEEKKKLEEPRCLEGCDLKKAYACFSVFSESVTDRLWGKVNNNTCKFINELKLCVTENTRTCGTQDYGRIYQTQRRTLHHFRGYKEGCVDVFQCASTFDSLARQIRDLGDDENSNRTAGTINKTPQEPPPRAPGLTELCANVRRAWGCLQNGLKSLPAFRRNILQPVYSAAWEAVEERCSNTKILTCYYCKKLTNFGFCKSRVQKCSHKEQACYVEEKILGNKREYTAKCIKPKHCNNGDGNGPKDSACCYDNKCNVDSLIGGPDVNAPEICDYGLSLECALDFTRTYIRSDNFSCSSAMADLRCIQEHRVTCGAGNKLYKAATEIFLKLATSSCVLDSNDPEDCYSLSIFSMQTMLSNAFSSQGNTVCVGLNETQASVKSMISSNQCSSAGAANLEQMLSFVETIVSSYCQQDQCISVPSTSPLIGNTECSGKIFDGIKLIYQAYSELEKNNDDVDCGILVISAASARTLLESCTLSPLVWKKLDALDKEVDSQCKPDRSLQIPEGCLNICNSKAFYNFTAQVSASLTEVTANDTSSCWHLTQLETAYNSLTVGCTSVQQADISAWVFSSMYSTINECKQIIPTFTFDLPLREDIYYEAVMCKANLKTGLEKAFADKDNQKLCDVIAAFNGCDINLPTSVVNLIIGSTRELVKSLEDMNVCGSSTTSGTDTRTVRQDLGYCYNLDFAAVIRELNSLPDIVTATMDTRDEACRNSDEIVARAKKASTDCGDRLPPVFKDALDILVEHIVERNSKLCLDLHYEDQQCDLDKIDKCWSDFDTICLYAALADGTLCRRAKFALECTYRFTQNCSGSDGDKAFVVRRNTKAQVRRIVGNNCPLLTAFLFCNGDVDSVHPACQLEADSTVACAEGIIDNYWSSAPMSEKCPALKANVNCVKTAVTGCEKGAVDKASWAKRIPTITTGLCGIDDFKLNDVCTSRDRCDNSLMVSCVAGQLNTCGAIINATGCVDNLLKKDRCYWDSLQSWLVMRLMEQKGITTMLTCGQQFTIPRPRRFDNTCLNSTLHTIREALHSTLGTDAQALYSTLEQFKLCLAVEVNAVEAVASRLLYDTISLITLPAGGPFVFNESDVFVDTENCAYTEAIACIEYELASILTVKLATPKEKDMLCNSVYQSTTAKCVKRALNGCPKADIERFQNIQAVSQGIVESLNICGSPKLCIISEAYVCVNKYGAALTAYDNSQELKELCMAKFAAEECLEMFTGSCSSDDSKPVKAEFDKLQSRVNEDCDKVELPRPPICPEIPEKSRVCRFGNSFRCMTNFNVRIMNGGDSLVWRQQCSNLQNMMACVATNTTSCDAESEDVETILDSLDALKASAADRCPWLTQDMCSREKPCPVATAGCEITLEKGLINSEKTVCELRDDAYACVAEYSTTCNAAQKAQAISVMDRKLESVGLPKELSCAEGSLDGLVYAALSAVRGFGVVSTVEETCKVIRAKVDNLTAEFNKESRGQFLTAGHTLLGHLRNALCEDGSACTSEQMPTVRATTYLISNMMLNDNFKMSAFCAQASEVALEISSQGCLMGFQRSVTTRNDLYPSNCQYKDPACNVIDAKIESCFSTINGMNKTVCQIAKERARCVSSFAISTCPKNETWFQPTCNTTVYLQSVDRSSTEMYISEAGSPTVFLWKLAGGNSDFYIKVESGPVKDSDVPRCLKGSRIDEPIPQVYFPYPSQRYSTEGDNVTITINARQDLRIDGNQEVELYFKVVPLTVKIMDNNEEFAKEEESEAYFLPSVKIFVEDRDLPQSTCSSINDPHVQTFDNIDYNVMDTGSFVLYRNIEYATAVVAEFKQCAKYGTCNCAVTVFASRVRFIYDLCDKDSENVQLTPDPANSAPDEQNEMLRVFKGDDMRTTYVVLVETGTVVTIKSDGEYINLWIMPSPRDFDKTQGLCGVFDGDGYNDFEMPDFSQYSLSDAENEDGVLSPVNFTSKWRRTSSQVENLVDIFAPNVEQKFAADSAFVDWTQDNVTTAMWGPLDHIAYCGFVEGEDITNKLVEAYNQNAIPRTRRRRKRQAENAETPEEINTPVAKWPTPSGRTKEDATSLCLNELSTQALEKCTAALFSIEKIKKKPNFMKSVDNCVDDIRLSDLTIWVNRSKEAINQLCLVELSKDPEYQKNQTASDLAVAFTNMTCSPSDCNRKGTCYRGQCRCEADFVGTGCQHRVTNIPVPKLVAPEDGFSMCQMGLNSNCSAVYITGQNFVDSRFLTCHFREVEITETGLSHVPGSKFERKGELISVDQVRCSYGERRSTKRTLEVSVSNNGQQEYPDYQLFIAYDPVCHSCDGNTCIEKDNVCTIGNKCVRAGDVSVYDDCFFCDPNQPTKWSIRGDLAHCKQHLDDAKDDDGSHILRNALIGAGCAVLMLVILLAVAIYLLAKRRKSNRRERRDDPPSYDNSSYSSDVFHGQPIPAYNRDYFLEKPRNPNSP